MISACIWSLSEQRPRPAVVEMFTGLIESVGCVRHIKQSDTGLGLHISLGSVDTTTLNLGDSIAVSGVCLTITALQAKTVVVHVSNETVSRTRMDQYTVGERVNIERSLTLAKPLGGHLVAGHVDGVAHCSQTMPDGVSRRLKLQVSGATLGRYMAEKGSIAIDGVSMTINSVQDQGDLTYINVNVIPHTLKNTTLGEVEVGDLVHIEVDLLARYAYRMMTYADSLHSSGDQH